jgi:NitT/TauT family transport system substrate-binding protein
MPLNNPTLADKQKWPRPVAAGRTIGGTEMIGSRLPLSALAVAMALFGAQAAAEPFRLIVTDLEPPLVPNSIMDLAVELGYFEREGVEVELVRVQQTPSAIAGLQAGEGEMANISVDSVLQLVGRDQMDLKAVVSPNKALPFLIAGKAEIDAPPALAGKSFGVGRVGSLDHTLSSKVLEANGVDVSTVEFVAIGQPNVRAQALAADQIDATTMSIGVWMALPDKEGLHVLIDQEAYYAAAPVVQKVNVVTDEVLENRRDDVAGVVRALITISRDFAAEPTKWVDAMAAARPDVSREDLMALAEAFAESWSVNGGLNREELEFTVDWTYESPDLEGVRRVELSEWVDFSLVDEALKATETHPGFDEPGR